MTLSIGDVVLETFDETADGGGDTTLVHGKGQMREAREVRWNISQTLQQLGGDEALLQEVLEIFLDEAPKHFAALRLAVAQERAKTVETSAHTLKGELGYMGLPHLLQMAAEIESMGRSNNVPGAAGLLSQFEADLIELLSAVRGAMPLAFVPPEKAVAPSGKNE